MSINRNIKNLKKVLLIEQQKKLLQLLKVRFEKNMNHHESLEWTKVHANLEGNSEKLWSLYEMEKTGGEPDIIGLDITAEEYLFCGCSLESPEGRRNVCYDHEGMNSRKEHRPKYNAFDMANDMGIELLSEERYRTLLELGDFDTITSSWIKTPKEARKLGGAIFADFRYGNVFIYHNGAQSYYSSRAFSGLLRV